MLNARCDYQNYNKSKEHVAKLKELLDAVNEATTKAYEYAKEHELAFSIDPTYGAGAECDPSRPGNGDGFRGAPDEFGWVASSQTC